MGPAARPHGPGTDRGAKRPLLRADPDPEGAQRGEGRVALHKHIYRESGCRRALSLRALRTLSGGVCQCGIEKARRSHKYATPCRVVLSCVSHVCSLKRVQVRRLIKMYTHTTHK